MNEFSTYSPEDIIGANLCEVAERCDMIWEQDAAHLRELALQLAEEGMSELPRTICEHRPASFYTRADTPLPAFESGRARQLRTQRSVFLCRELRKIADASEPFTLTGFFPDPEEPDESAIGRIVYQRSSYADEAYLRFSAVLQTPRARYAHSFAGVCEDVYNGLCEFGLLPLESSSEGQLTGFSRLIDRYELKIAATCDIPANDGLRHTKFALVRRDMVSLEAVGDKRDCYFEFSARLDLSPSPSELLSAAALCGLSLHRLDCRTHGEDEDADRMVHYVLCIGEGDLIAFLLYLAMEAPHYCPTGIYYHLQERK